MTEYDDINRLLNEAARRLNEKFNTAGSQTVFGWDLAGGRDHCVVLDFVKGRDGVWRMQPDR